MSFFSAVSSWFDNSSQYKAMRKEQLENMRFAKDELSIGKLSTETNMLADSMGIEGGLAYENLAVDSQARGVGANLRQLLDTDSGSALGAIYGAAVRSGGRMHGNNLRRQALLDVFDRVVNKQGVLAAGYAGLPTVQRDLKSPFEKAMTPIALGGSVMEAFGGNPWATDKDGG